MKKLNELLYAQGFADAYGYVIEFQDWSLIKNKNGKNGYPYLPNISGEFIASDDTQMSLFTLEGISDYQMGKYPDIKTAVYKAYKRWYNTQIMSPKNNEDGVAKFVEMWARRAPGNTCLQALSGYTMGTIYNNLNDSKGCGGIMRVLPSIFKAKSMNEAFNWGCDFAAMTHSHPSGYYSAGVYNALGWCLLNGQSPEEALGAVRPFLLRDEKAKETLQSFDIAVKNLKDGTVLEHDDMVAAFGGGGWTGETALSFAIYVGLQFNISYQRALEWSANHSGDSDSTAMLAAGLWYLNSENKETSEFMPFKKKLDLGKVIESAVEYSLIADEKEKSESK